MKISNTNATVFPADLQHRQSKRITAENAVQRRELSVSSDTDTVSQSKTSVLDLYYRMRQTKRAAKEEYDKVQTKESVRKEPPEQEESETKTDIIVKPDGSRVLVITTMTGGLETTMSLEIAKPISNHNLTFMQIPAVTAIPMCPAAQPSLLPHQSASLLPS